MSETDRITCAARQELVDSLDADLRYAIEVEGKLSMDDVENYEEVRNSIRAALEGLRDTPNREECPLIYHLDVAAMYPNIILTNRCAHAGRRSPLELGSLQKILSLANAQMAGVILPIAHHCPEAGLKTAPQFSPDRTLDGQSARANCDRPVLQCSDCFHVQPGQDTLFVSILYVCYSPGLLFEEGCDPCMRAQAAAVGDCHGRGLCGVRLQPAW